MSLSVDGQPSAEAKQTGACYYRSRRSQPKRIAGSYCCWVSLSESPRPRRRQQCCSNSKNPSHIDFSMQFRIQRNCERMTNLPNCSPFVFSRLAQILRCLLFSIDQCHRPSPSAVRGIALLRIIPLRGRTGLATDNITPEDWRRIH